MIIEKDFYLEKEDNQIGCVMLNQLILSIAPLSDLAIGED